MTRALWEGVPEECVEMVADMWRVERRLLVAWKRLYLLRMGLGRDERGG